MSENLSTGDGLGDAQGRPRYKPERPTPEIPLETFLEAQQDPKVRKFLREAWAESQELKKQGFLHL